MSFLLGFGQSFLSGLSSVSSGLTSSISGIVNDINGAFANFSNFFQQLPSQIQSFFQTVAGALIAFGHTFGSYILSGLQWVGNAISSAMVPIERGLNTLGSMILNALTTLWNDLKAFASYVYNAITSSLSGVFGVVQGLINDIKDTAVTMYNFLVNVLNDAYGAFTYIFNTFFNLPQFFSQVSEFFNSLFGGSGGSNLLNVVPNIIASEASRVASAFPDVVAYNTFMEMMPKIIYGIANSPYFGNGIQGAFSKAMLMMASPVLSAFVAMFTKSFMQNLFTPTQTTQTVSRPSTPQVQPFTSSPSVQLPQRSASTTAVSDVGQLQLPSLTAEQIELEIERPNVTGVFVEDVIGLGTPGGGTAQLVQGFVNFQNAVQKFEDAFEIIPNFFMKLLTSLQTELSQDMTVNVTLTILENIFQATSTVEVLPSVDATAIILPYGITFCNPNNAPQPTESSSMSSNQVNVNASVQIEEGMCIPPFNLLTDGLYTTYGILNEMEPTISDLLLGNTQITNSMTSSQMLSDSVSVSVSFQSSPPSTETITYYTPVDVANTYVIQVQQAYYYGQLNYNVSGS
jgi:hypothetical protein